VIQFSRIIILNFRNRKNIPVDRNLFGENIMKKIETAKE